MGRYHNGRLKEVTMDDSDDDMSYTPTKSKKPAKRNIQKGTKKNQVSKTTPAESSAKRKRTTNPHTPCQAGEATAQKPFSYQALGSTRVKEEPVALTGLHTPTSGAPHHEQGNAIAGPDAYSNINSGNFNINNANVYGDPQAHNVSSYSNATGHGAFASEFDNLQHSQYPLTSTLQNPFGNNNFSSYFEDSMDTMYPDGNYIDGLAYQAESAAPQFDSQYGYNMTDSTSMNPALLTEGQDNDNHAMHANDSLSSMPQGGDERMQNNEMDEMDVDATHQDVDEPGLETGQRRRRKTRSNRIASPSPSIESEYEESDIDNPRPSKTPKLNKDGVPRKPRRPRPKLLKWNDTDWKNVALGLVWACGEHKIPIPFSQASQVVGESCTAGALQQALLKLRGKQIAEGFQIPPLKMAWTRKKNGDSEGDDTNAKSNWEAPASKTHLVRKKPTRQQSCQSRIITFKRAYREDDRSHLAVPYKHGKPSRQRSTLIRETPAAGPNGMGTDVTVKEEGMDTSTTAWPDTSTNNTQPLHRPNPQAAIQTTELLPAFVPNPAPQTTELLPAFATTSAPETTELLPAFTPTPALQIETPSFGSDYSNMIFSSQSTDYNSTLPSDSQYASTDMSQSFSLPMTPTSMPNISNVNTPGGFMNTSGFQFSPTSTNFQTQWSSQNDMGFPSPLYSPVNFGVTTPSTPARNQGTDTLQSLLRRDSGAGAPKQATKSVDQNLRGWNDPFGIQPLTAQNPFVEALKTGSFYNNIPENGDMFDLGQFRGN